MNKDFILAELVNDIREQKPSNIAPLFDYLLQEFIQSIVTQLVEMGVKPGEKYVFDKRMAEKFGVKGMFRHLTYLCSEKPFDAMDYCPVIIDGKYYGIWLALKVHDVLDREKPCVLLNGNTICYAEKIYNYLIEKQ